MQIHVYIACILGYVNIDHIFFFKPYTNNLSRYIFNIHNNFLWRNDAILKCPVSDTPYSLYINTQTPSLSSLNIYTHTWVCVCVCVHNVYIIWIGLDYFSACCLYTSVTKWDGIQLQAAKASIYIGYTYICYIVYIALTKIDTEVSYIRYTGF